MAGTDNSNFEKKVELRLSAISDIPKNDISVLDCFAGYGMLWKEVKKRTKKNIHIVSIEKEKGKNPTALCGDNLKFLPNLDLDKFDLIDLDAYGVPTSQILILKNKDWHGILVVTAIESMMGQMPTKLVESVGISELYKKNKALFSKYFVDFLDNFLYLCGVKEKKGFFLGRKLYFYVKF